MFFSLYTLNLIPINYHVQRLRSCEFNINLLLLLLLLYFYIIINNFNYIIGIIISDRIISKCTGYVYCVYHYIYIYCVQCIYCTVYVFTVSQVILRNLSIARICL